MWGQGSAVRVATHYGLDGPGIESWWGRAISHPSRPAPGPTQPPVQWVPGLSSGIKLPGRGVGHPTHPAPWLKKEYSYTSTPPLGVRGLL